MLSIADLRERLTEIRPPGAGRDLVALGAVRALDLRDGKVDIRIALPGLPETSVAATVAEIRRAIGAFDEVDSVAVEVVQAPAAAIGALPGVRHILAVSSAKGGVGKSTVATNLAVAMARSGLRIGILDADVYGPSLPTMLGVSGRPYVGEDKRIFPLEAEGIRIMSIGFFLDDTSPVIWRGPLVMGLMRQFLQDVEWGELDYLIIDMPPGTGDAQLTLVQQVPLVGAIVVTTPQTVSTIDVERGIAMFERVHTPVLGLVENMSTFVCPDCGTQDDIFGTGGAAQLAERHGVPWVAQIPLYPDVRVGGDRGRPIVGSHPDHPASEAFRALATSVVAAVESRSAEHAPPLILD